MARGSRSPPPVRDSNSRSHAHVGFLVILALVSLVLGLGLGLSAYRKVQPDTVPAAQEHNRRLNAVAEPPKHVPPEAHVQVEE